MAQNYWRYLKYKNMSYSSINVAEIQVFSGGNAIPIQSITSNIAPTSGSLTQLYDGDLVTKLQFLDPSPYILEMIIDLGAGINQTITQLVTIHGASHLGMRFFVSLDNTNWTQVPDSTTGAATQTWDVIPDAGVTNLAIALAPPAIKAVSKLKTPTLYKAIPLAPPAIKSKTKITADVSKAAAGLIALGATLKAVSKLTPPTLSKTSPVAQALAASLKAVSKVTAPLSTVDTYAAHTWVTPTSGTYTDAVTVTINSDDPTATIRYTLDGSAPDLSSAIYSTPLAITSTKTLKWYSKDPAGNIESAQTANYTVVESAMIGTQPNYIYCYDRAENLIAILDNMKPTTCPFYGAQLKEVMGGEYTLQFTVPYDHADAKLLAQDGYVIVKDINESYQLFCITRFEDQHGVYAERTVFCEQAQIELLDEVIESLTIAVGATATEGLTQILSGTRWTLGTVTDPTTISTPFVLNNTDRLNALRLFAARWRGDMTFRFEIYDKTFYRYIDFEQLKGVYTGRRFEYTQDIQEVTREIDTSQIKTALIGVGGNEDTPVDFSGVTWTTPTNPTNKPAGQRYVESPTAKTKWGRLNASGQRSHLWGFYKNSEDTDPANLLQDTWEALQRNLEPKIKYSVKVVDLSRLLGTGAQILRIGDSVNIIDRDLDIAIQARILERTIDLNAKENSNVVLGEFNETLSATIADQVTPDAPTMPDLSGYLKEGDPIYTSWLTGQISALQNQINASGANVTIDDNGILIVDPNNSNKAMKLGGGIFGLATSKTNNVYNWTAFGTADGFTANNVNTGTLRANSVMILGDTNFYWNGTNLKAVNPANSAEFVALGKIGAEYGLGFTLDGGATYRIKLTKDGFKANNGTTDTFVIDKNGNATFAGTLAAGISLTSPKITGGDITGGTITGQTTVSVGTDLNVGSNIYLNYNATENKMIHFGNGGAAILATPSGTLKFSAMIYNMTEGSVYLGGTAGSANGVHITNDCTFDNAGQSGRSLIKFVSGCDVDFMAGSTVDFTGSTVTGLVARFG